MEPDIIEFVESTLGIKLTEFQKWFLITYYEHKDEITEPLYLYVGRSQKKVLIEALKAIVEALKPLEESYGMTKAESEENNG